MAMRCPTCGEELIVIERMFGYRHLKCPNEHYDRKEIKLLKILIDTLKAKLKRKKGA